MRTVGDSLGGYLPEMYETVIAEHEKIIAAFEKHDPIGAGQAVFDHVTAARDRLLVRKEGLFSEPSRLARTPSAPVGAA